MGSKPYCRHLDHITFPFFTARKIQNFGPWVSNNKRSEEFYSWHQEHHSHTFSDDLASQNFTTLDSPTRLHYLTRLHSVSSRAFSDLRLGEASFKINLEQLLLKRNPIFVCTFPDIHIVGMSIWNPMKPISISLEVLVSRSILRKFEATHAAQKWINEQINEITLSPAGPGLIWRQLVEWLIGEWFPPTDSICLAPIKILEDTRLWLVNLGKWSILIGWYQLIEECLHTRTEVSPLPTDIDHIHKTQVWDQYACWIRIKTLYHLNWSIDPLKMLYKSENVYPILTGLFWSSYYYEGGGGWFAPTL